VACEKIRVCHVRVPRITHTTVPAPKMLWGCLKGMLIYTLQLIDIFFYRCINCKRPNTLPRAQPKHQLLGSSKTHSSSLKLMGLHSPSSGDSINIRIFTIGSVLSEISLSQDSPILCVDLWQIQAPPTPLKTAIILTSVATNSSARQALASSNDQCDLRCACHGVTK
jgi:hypothetical protein